MTQNVQNAVKVLQDYTVSQTRPDNQILVHALKDIFLTGYNANFMLRIISLLFLLQHYTKQIIYERLFVRVIRGNGEDRGRK
jgi:hypothetical protein